MLPSVMIASGMGVGAGLMYLLDPDRGTRRRALLRDHAAKARRLVTDGADATTRDLRNRAYGWWREITSCFRRDDAVADDTLRERVRAKLGMLLRHPSAVVVQVDRGRVRLTGPVLADEVDHLIGILKRVPGVTEVVNELEVHQDASGVPGLQGGPVERRIGERSEWMQRHWSPSARLTAGVAGTALTMYGASKRSLPGVTIAAVGVGLLARSVRNRPLAEQLLLARR